MAPEPNAEIVVEVPLDGEVGEMPGAALIQSNMLARQARRLRIVRRVIQQPRASLPGNDVDDGALNVAEFGRRPRRLDLDFLNEIDARLGARDAVAGAGEVGAVDQKLILVRTGAER